ncbi:hypothetical protein PghCCS26_58850 [Paenibacillus glycanilyticus]|uniref:Uncharacterized protein n=1 Tax=Paenibacillus glycanilyticus TaxID=126569 RepID=A0ABQ6NUJ6_9BACL|nr:hypothetical protein [Paenibacillus glycanilyticus]GMK48755.1 hypothetical protein PghCCS26_58850 [Paenibacillus glycanilyticus]
MDCERLYGIRLPKFTPEQTPEPLQAANGLRRIREGPVPAVKGI